MGTDDTHPKPISPKGRRLSGLLSILLGGLLPLVASGLSAAAVWVGINLWYLSIFWAVPALVEYGTHTAGDVSVWRHDRYLASMVGDTAESLSGWWTRPDYYSLPWYMTASVSYLITERWLTGLLVVTGLVALCGAVAQWLAGRLTGCRDGAAASGRGPWWWVFACVAGAGAGALVWYVSCPRDAIDRPVADAGVIENLGLIACVGWFAAVVFPARTGLLLLWSARDPAARMPAGDCLKCGYPTDAGRPRCPECGLATAESGAFLRNRGVWWVRTSLLIPGLAAVVVAVSLCWDWPPPYSVVDKAARWATIRTLSTYARGGLLVLPRNEVTLVKVGGTTYACIPFYRRLTVPPTTAEGVASETVGHTVFAVAFDRQLGVMGKPVLHDLHSWDEQLFRGSGWQGNGHATVIDPVTWIALPRLMWLRVEAPVTMIERTDRAFDEKWLQAQQWKDMDKAKHALWLLLMETTRSQKMTVVDDIGLGEFNRLSAPVQPADQRGTR